MAKSVAQIAVGAGATAQALLLTWQFSETAALPGDAADKLAIVVEEWILNIIEHGEAGEGVIDLTLERRAANVTLTVASPGVAFDPREVDFDGPNEERGGGAGLALIKAWTTIADYRREDDCNHIVFELPIG